MKITNMKKIDPAIYKLFLKHGSECLWTSDTRVPRPKGTSEETDEMLYILEEVDTSLGIINSELYSNDMKLYHQKKVDELKPLFAEDLFDLLRKKYLKNNDS